MGLSAFLFLAEASAMARASHGLELEHEAVVLLLPVEVSVICHMKLVHARVG